MKLTPSQQAAVLYTDGDSSIIAAAGSGKTSVLVEKVALLVEKFHVPLSEILVVTFTDKAAEEIQGRIYKRLRSEEQGFVGTLHAFAATVLREKGEIIRIDPKFKILDEFMTRLERVRTVREVVLNLIESKHSELLSAVESYGLKRTLHLFRSLLEKSETAPYPSVIQEIRNAYEKRKRDRNLLDYDDLERRLLELLAEKKVVSLRWILVDEFQDINPIQWKIIYELHDPSKNHLVIVGDPRQSIYRFRGADPSLFKKVTGEILKRGGKRFDLSENFRSDPKVIAYVNEVSGPLFSDDFPPLIAKAPKTANGSVECLSLPEVSGIQALRECEATAIAARLVSLREEGYPWKKMALLFRTRKSVPIYLQSLREKGIPIRSSLGEPLLDRPEVLAVHFLLKKLSTTDETVRRFCDIALPFSPLRSFEEAIPCDPLSSFMEGLVGKVFPLFTDEPAARNLEAFRKIIESLIELGAKDLKEILESLSALRDEGITCPHPPEEGGDAVRLMTVHAAKGLEFPIVVLCDLNAKPPPRTQLYVRDGAAEVVLKDKSRETTGLKEKLEKSERFQELENKEKEEELEESKRLLYVAMTRAIERLILPLSPPSTKEKKKESNRWSDWLMKA